MTERWTVLPLVQTSAEYLAKNGSDTPRLDAELLLCRVLATDRVGLYVRFDRPLDTGELDAYRTLVRRRAKGEPVAYLTGEREFYGLRLRVDSRVLIPRPETELLVDRALELLPPGASARVLDIGTGSGAIAIVVARQRPSARVEATEIDPAALDLARENAAACGVADRIVWHSGDLFASAAGPFDLILSNPPYIDPDQREALPVSVRDFEPAAALFAADHGLYALGRIVQDAARYSAANGSVLLEIGFDQARAVCERIEAAGRFEAPRVHRDAAGLDRLVEARLKAD